VSGKDNHCALVGEHVRGVHAGSVNWFERDEITVISVEQGDFPNIDMTSLSCRMESLGDEDGSLVIFKNYHIIVLWVTKLIKNRAEIGESKATSIGCRENLRLCGAE
jgi:hypothetical protein